MNVTARARHFLARHGWVYWVAVATLAAVCAVTVQRQLTALEQARDRWQQTRTVLVADADLVPGDPVRATATELPLAALPPSALTALPAGSEIRQRVAAGEVIVDTDLATGGGPAARAEPGTVVVALSDPLSRAVAVGLTVQVAADGIVLAERATVVEAIDDVVFVAVSNGDAAAVAAAAQQGIASLLYLP